MKEITEHMGQLALAVAVTVLLIPMVVFLVQGPLKYEVMQLMNWVM